MSKKKEREVARFEILGQSHPIYNGMNIIGRDIEASIIIKNLKISKKHAAISVIENKHYITDFKSSNGCSYQGEILIPFKFYEIEDRDNITLGDLVGTYYIESSSSQDEQFLKPKVAKHIYFAPTQQIIEIPRTNTSDYDTYFAATQLIDNTKNQSSSNTTGNSNNVFSLIEINKTTNDSHEVVLCNDSLNDNLDESFAKVTLDESVEVPCTQECFSKPQEDNYNDSNIVPCTQDVSFNSIKDTKDCGIHKNEDDSDATDTEISHDDMIDDNICISIKKLTPEPLDINRILLQNSPDKNTTTLSDDEEIDFCDLSTNQTENVLNPSVIISEVNTTKASSCVNDLDQNINESDLQNTSFKSKTGNESNKNDEPIPEMNEFNINATKNKFLDQSVVIPSTQDTNEDHINCSKIKSVDIDLKKDINTSNTSSIDVDFMAPTQLLSNESTLYASVHFKAPNKLLIAKNIPPEVDNIDDAYLAPTQILDMSTFENNFKNPKIQKSTPTKHQDNDVNKICTLEEKSKKIGTEFKMPGSIKKNKSSLNESLNEDDDVNFLASTQEMLNNSTNSESESNRLDYHSSQEIDSIPEITVFQNDIEKNNEIFTSPTQVLEKFDYLITQENADFSAKTQILENRQNKNIIKPEIDFSVKTQILEKQNKDLNSKPGSTRNRQQVDFSAKTQVLENIPIISERSKLSKKHDITKKVYNNRIQTIGSLQQINLDILDFSNRKITKNQNANKEFEVNFSEPTQKLNKNFDDGDNVYFMTSTQILMSNRNELATTINDNVFLAPTQELILNTKEVTRKSKFTTSVNLTPKTDNLTKSDCTSSTSFQKVNAVDDDIFLAPTQELIDKSIKNMCRVDQLKEIEEITDSDDSDIVIKKKRPKRIKETQDIDKTDSDSDSEIGYKHKKPTRIFETQELQNEFKPSHNDSAVISDLGDTDESIRLFVSESFNVSQKSTNTSSKEDESQLEINLPTEKEYFVSQNTRPKNPLVQVLSSKEKQMLNSQNEVVIGSSAALNMFVNLLNDSLEPTQITIDELVNESMVHTQDSDPEDYGPICEMETQPIDDIFHEVKSQIVEKKITKKGKNKKQNDKIFLEPVVMLTREKTNKIENEAGPSKEINSKNVKGSILSNKTKTNKQDLSTKHKELITESTTRVNRKRLSKDSKSKGSIPENNSTDESNIPRRLRKHNLKRKDTLATTSEEEKQNESSINKGVISAKMKRVDDPENEDVIAKTSVNKQKELTSTNMAAFQSHNPASDDIQEKTTTKTRTIKKAVGTSRRSTRATSVAKEDYATKIMQTNDNIQEESTSSNMEAFLQGEANVTEKKNYTIDENVKSSITKRVTNSKQVTKTAKYNDNINESISDNMSAFLLGKRKVSENEDPTSDDNIQETTSKKNTNEKVVETTTRSTRLQTSVTKEDTPIPATKVIQTHDNIQKELTSDNIEAFLQGETTNTVDENIISTKTKRVRNTKQVTKPVKCNDNILSESTSDNMAAFLSGKRKVSEKNDPTSDDNIQEKTSTKRNTNTKVVKTTRRTRASSVMKEDTAICAAQTNRTTKQTSDISDFELNIATTKSRSKSFLSVHEEPKKKTTKSFKNREVVSLTNLTASEEEATTDEDEFSKRKKTTSIKKSKQEPSIDKKENNKRTNTRKKILSDSFSLDASPTKKLKTNPENVLEFNPSLATTSSPRRETRLRHKVVFTMLDDANLEATVCRLGGSIVNSSQECTVLVTSKISRSLKFLVAVSQGKPIVGPEWVKACGAAHKFVDPWDYILKDNESEKKFNFSLRGAIIQGQNTKLLEGYTCLLLVNKNLDVLKNVIEASGGNCVTRVPKNGDFIVISYPEDKNKYGKFLKQKPPVKCFGAEAIFAGALTQKLMFNEHVLK